MAEPDGYETPTKGSNAGTSTAEVYRVEERPEHGMRILHALNKLKTDKILCDVTLIAEGLFIKFNENGREFSISVENTVGKEEIARYEQFLLFPQCFQKTCSTNT